MLSRGDVRTVIVTSVDTLVHSAQLSYGRLQLNCLLFTVDCIYLQQPFLGQRSVALQLKAAVRRVAIPVPSFRGQVT